TYREKDRDVSIVWLVPISRGEAEFVRFRGWRQFEDEFAKANPDLVDIKREPIFGLPWVLGAFVGGDGTGLPALHGHVDGVVSGRAVRIGRARDRRLGIPGSVCRSDDQLHRAGSARSPVVAPAAPRERAQRHLERRHTP